MFHISVGLFLTSLGGAFGLGLLVAEPINRLLGRYLARRAARSHGPH
jgi:hypothetical protein